MLVPKMQSEWHRTIFAALSEFDENPELTVG